MSFLERQAAPPRRTPLTGAPVLIWLLLAVNLLNYSAHRGSKVGAALLAADLGATAWTISVLASLYALVPALSALVSGKAIDRAGVAVPLLAGTFAIGAALLLPAALPSIPVLFASAALIGAGQVLYHVSIQNAIGRLSRENERTRNFAAYSLTVSLGAAIGPSIAGFTIDQWGHGSAFVVLAACAFAACLLLSFARPALAARHLGKAGAEPANAASLLAVEPLRRVIVVSALVMAAYELYSFYLPLHAHAAGLSATASGAILSAFGIAAVVVRMALPWMVARAREETLLACCLVVAGAAYAALPLAREPFALTALSFTIGMTLGCGPALLVAMTYARAPAGRSGEALGLRLSLSYGTHAVLPVVFGGLATALGVAAIFVGNALLLELGAVYLLGRAWHWRGANRGTVKQP